MALLAHAPKLFPDPSTATSKLSERVVIALHGTLGEPATFQPLAAALEEHDIPLIAPEYGRRGTESIHRCAAEVATLIAALPDSVTRVDVVGHSLGGLVALRALLNPGARRRVHTLVGLGAAWRGTDNAAWYWPDWLVRSIFGESFVELDHHVEEPAVPDGVRVVSIVSDADRVVPAWSSRLGAVVIVHGVRHNALPKCTDEILAGLGLESGVKGTS